VRSGNSVKQQEYQRLKQRCIQFFKDIYREDEKVIVFGEGNLDARIVLVGEAPGEQECIEGRPFVGQAGKNLNEFLDILQWKRESLYITNAVKFRPYKVNPETGRKINRPPNREELALCFSWLLKELDLVDPEIVVTLGNVPLRTITGDGRMNIGSVHGRPLEVELPDVQRRYLLFPLYHPASVIYRKNLRVTYLEDLKKLKAYLEVHSERNGSKSNTRGVMYDTNRIRTH